MPVILLLLAQIAIYVNGESVCNLNNSLESIKKINWDIIGQNEMNIAKINVTLDVSQQDVTLNIIAKLEYLGYSIADGTDGYGTTYNLDFKSFNAHSSSISNPGICSNKIIESFANNKPFNEWWEYSQCPSIPDEIGQIDTFLAYSKPSKYWSISMDDTQRNMIIYDGTFKLNELLICDGINIIKNAEWLNVTGTFYINLISPLNKNFDIGYYYIYQLYSSPFIICIEKTINIISSTGISLFTISIVAVYKQDQESKYKLILLTESADYLSLIPDEILSTPNTQKTELILISDDKTSNGECVAIKNNICSQMFELTNSKTINCANDLFSGEYIIRFNVECNPNILGNTQETTICNNWLNINKQFVDLSTSLNWNDNVCETKTYLIKFKAKMQFYIDNTFNDASLQKDDGLYEIGIDRVYVKINLENYQDDDAIYDIINLQLINVWLCTVDETEELILNDNNDGNGGCFTSSLIDDDGPYYIIQNNQIAVGYDNIDTILYDNTNNNNDVRFSFIVPDTIVRTKLYIHGQLNIDILETKNGEKRRLLIENNEVDQIRHYMNSIQLQKQINFLEHKLKEQEKNINKWTYKWFIFVIVILLIAFSAMIFAIYVIIKNYKFKGSTFSRYSIIKNKMFAMTTDDDKDDLDDDQENDNLIWRDIIEDQQEKANSV